MKVVVFGVPLANHPHMRRDAPKEQGRKGDGEPTKRGEKETRKAPGRVKRGSGTSNTVH